MTAWEAADRLCSKRLQPFSPELVSVLRRQDRTTITAKVEAQPWPSKPSYHEPGATPLAAVETAPSLLHYQAGQLAQELHSHPDLRRLGGELP